MNSGVYLVNWQHRWIVEGDRRYGRFAYLFFPGIALLVGSLILLPIVMVLRAPSPMKMDDLLLSLVIFGIPGIVVIVSSLKWARRNSELITQGTLIDATITESTNTYREALHGRRGYWWIRIAIAVTTPTGKTFVRYESMQARSPDGLPPPVGTVVKVLYLNDDQFEIM